MLDNLTIYDLIYALAADCGRENALFGTCAPLAREAFSRSLIGEGFPLTWFEVPLVGAPRFDLHVALSRKTLCEGVAFAPGAGNGYDGLFSWYATEETGGNGLAFAYDVSEGRIDNPAVHVNVNNAPLSDIARFFDLAAGNGAAQRYSSFADRLPKGWHTWYAGVHPGRAGAPVRVDCFVDESLKDAYAHDAALLERDLRISGFEATSPALFDLAGPILDSPFSLELQFDVMEDATPGSTLGLSVAFPLASAPSMHLLFDDGGAAAALMERIEGLGLADARWHDAADAMFSTRINVGVEALALYCLPTFVKLRLRSGEPLDAKLYYQAGAYVL